ncbi:putative sensor-like histidine kinase [compost metagenome]
MCYPDLFQYEIVLSDDRLLEIPVLKILLQPLVENAILHGFQNLTRQGDIRIEVKASDDLLTMTVNDNGCGMTEELIEKVLHGGQDKVRSSYALSNVISRLNLYYDYRATLNLTSEVDVGTSVRLTIPMTRGEFA